MKSIFLGKEVNINRVYVAEIRERIRKYLELSDEIFAYDDIINKGSDAEIAFSTWGMPVLTEAEIKQKLPKLKAIFYGAGTVQEFARPFLSLGIKVFSAWAANAVPVAEYSVAQIILANKGFYQSQLRFSSEGFHKARDYSKGFPGTYGGKVGIIGCGMIGSMVAERLKAYKLSLLAFDPFMSDERAAQLGVEKCSLERLFSECQTVSNHLANNPQTVGMLNYDLFSKMKNNATFINTGRGAQVIEKDLIRALKEEPERTAVLDVTCPEPPEPESEFYTLANVLLTPHIAGSSGDEVVRMGDYMVSEMISYLTGAPVKFEVTEEMLLTMA